MVALRAHSWLGKRDGNVEVLLQSAEKTLSMLRTTVGVMDAAAGFLARFSDVLGPFSSVASGVTLILDVGLSIVKMVQSVHANHQQCRVLAEYSCNLVST